MNLDFGRCQVYKLNISACLTERELDYYNLFCDGITRKELKKRLGVDYPTSEMLSEEFHISLEDAADLLKAQMNKKCFRKFLTDEIEKFSPNEVREIRKSAIYVADEEGNLTDRIKDNKKIVWFGNECVRRCNVDLKDIPLLDQFLLLKCGSKALTGVLNQIVERGVNLDGKHYLFYTSTTGQMKETEITLVEEEYWKENEYDSNLLSILKQGIAELAKEDYIRIIKDLKNEYIIDFEKLYLDTEKDYFVKMFVEEIQQILLLEESIKKKMSLLKYFIVICSTFNWSKDMGKYQGKISGMSLEYFADLTGISSKTCNRYNIILEKNHLLFVYRSNDKMKNFDGTMRQINNCYSRYCDKELCIAYATDYENRYGYEHKIVQTRKNKEEADKNRRLAAIYNRICEGHEYPIEVVREVQKYIRNKNQYLQKLIDEKKAQSYMAFSEKEWVARLESQLRDESVFLQAKLESDCEFESNIWGEPNPLDIFIEEAV